MLVTFAPMADKVNAVFEDSIVFFDPGGNWSGVACQACGKDAKAWWQKAMSASFEGAYENLGLAAPCCGAQVSLNNLRYGSPAAFGRFALEAMNPNIRDLQPEQEAQLSQALGCELRKVWVHI